MINLFSAETCKFCPLGLVSLFFLSSFRQKSGRDVVTCCLKISNLHLQRLQSIKWWCSIPMDQHADYADQYADNERYSSNSPGKHRTGRSTMLHRTYQKKLHNVDCFTVRALYLCWVATVLATHTPNSISCKWYMLKKLHKS